MRYSLAVVFAIVLVAVVGLSGQRLVAAAVDQAQQTGHGLVQQKRIVPAHEGQSCVLVGRGTVCTPAEIPTSWELLVKNDYLTLWLPVSQQRYEQVAVGDHV